MGNRIKKIEKKNFEPFLDIWPGTNHLVVKIPFKTTWGIEENKNVILFIDEAEAILNNHDKIIALIKKAKENDETPRKNT